VTTQTFKLTPKQCEVRSVFAKAYQFLLVFGGSRSGKTFFIVYAIVTRALKSPGSRHAIFRNDRIDAEQSIAKDTLPKVVELAYPDLAVKWHAKDGYFEFPNGSEIWIGGLKDKERLDKVLGREFATIYLNEASQITLEAFELVKTRLAQNVVQVDGRKLALKFYVDLNPTTRAHWTYRIFVEGINPIDDSKIPHHDEDYAFLVVNPADNLDNLPAEYLRMLEALPERQRRRFKDGKYSADDDNALWRRGYIKVVEPPEMERIVVAVDPAATSKPGSDETGIVVMGLGVDGFGDVLADESGKFRPEEWARRAISAFDTFDADCIVGEVNQGGEMVEAMIKQAAGKRSIRYKPVTATRNKKVRAEPIAGLYEQGKVRHAQSFNILEDQMCAFTLDFDRNAQGYSPDRVDALVWAATELFRRIIRGMTPPETTQTKAPRGFDYGAEDDGYEGESWKTL
jgi:phage terminase large subunit-like protein